MNLFINLGVVFLVSMLFHEFGHYIALINYGVSKEILEIRIMPFKPFIGVGYEGNYTHLSNEDYIVVLLAGIGLGIGGLWLSIDALGFPDMAILPLFAQYLFFCKSDIKGIIGVMENARKRNKQ